MTRHVVAVLGAGAWGAALANVASQGRERVALWDRDAEHVAHLARERENRRYLPGLKLASAIVPTERTRGDRKCGHCSGGDACADFTFRRTTRASIFP